MVFDAEEGEFGVEVCFLGRAGGIFEGVGAIVGEV